MWDKEEKLIDNLGLLYPKFDWASCTSSCEFKHYSEFRADKLWWIMMLCTEHLNQRIPQLERMMKFYTVSAWFYYMKHFQITDIES